MEEAGLVPLGGIMLTLVLHQTAERGEYEVLILRRHHRRVPPIDSGLRLEDPVLRGADSSPSLRSGSGYWIGSELTGLPLAAP
jgi:hypothetical protein